MNSDEEETMKEHGITKQTTTIYLYEGHSYAKLQDAVKYAQIQQSSKDTETNGEND